MDFEGCCLLTVSPQLGFRRASPCSILMWGISYSIAQCSHNTEYHLGRYLHAGTVRTVPKPNPPAPFQLFNPRAASWCWWGSNFHNLSPPRLKSLTQHKSKLVVRHTPDDPRNLWCPSPPSRPSSSQRGRIALSSPVRIRPPTLGHTGCISRAPLSPQPLQTVPSRRQTTDRPTGRLIPHHSSSPKNITMSDLNSWEDDPSAQDENLARQAQQQLNVNPGNPAPAQGSFRPSVASFQPGAASFQPGQQYGGYAQQYQQQPYYQQGYYPQYGAQQGFNNQGYSGGYNQGYGMMFAPNSCLALTPMLTLI